MDFARAMWETLGRKGRAGVGDGLPQSSLTGYPNDDDTAREPRNRCLWPA